MVFLLSNLSYLDLDGEFDMDVSDVVSFKGLIHFLMGFTKRAIDPIVFQYSPYGVVIHSVWGEEAEDKVFEEYKKVNQLLSL